MAASIPSSPVSQSHFAFPPAIPMTRHPLIFAICAAAAPVAPAAPETTTVSHAAMRPTSSSPIYAVSPVTPSVFSATGSGTPGGTLLVARSLLGLTTA